MSEDEIKCFVSGCDEAKPSDAHDASASDEDECMISGVCPVGETRGFHLSGAGKAAATKPGSPRPAAPRYAGTGSSAKVAGGKVAAGKGKIARVAMPTSRKSLDMRLSFELGSATLTADARQQADIFARQLKDGAVSREFVIEGHTDNIGNSAYNRQLSRDRAQAVVNYLVAAGVPTTRLRAVGYGFDHPRDGTVASDPSNRRVEIVRY